jgi:uncharacterized protein DUF3667
VTIESPAFKHRTDIEPPVHGCANCGAPALDTHCPACGQNTRERLPTFGEFMREATGRYVAYDGKFWKTLGALLLRPGFLTREYLAGRRGRYIGPARLFLVSSLLLFATLKFATDAIDMDEAIQFDPPKEPRSRAGGGEKPDAREVPALPQLPGKPDAGGKSEHGERLRNAGKDDKGDFVTLDDDLNLNLSELAGRSGILAKPIARFNSLPRAQKIEQLKAGTLRYGPYAMFALLPAIALLQKILYLGRGCRYPARPRLYGEHLVFAAHNHAFLFVAGSLITVLGEGWIVGILATWMFVYLAWATRVVYGGGWLGIAGRAMVLGLAYLILFAFVTIGLVAAAVLLR